MDKNYYSVFTANEKVWIYADMAVVEGGSLVFYDSEVDGNPIAIASFGDGYWKYFYEADEETGESIASQIPFWKRHPPTTVTPGAVYKEKIPYPNKNQNHKPTHYKD